ncbi:uncharacterized protein CLUP02_09985 [Colletotrichum lupini]|uniref:DUF6590 domain-containing protein n=1 Tax=Colletotrichum lupini TaxID=145971 RepID=A0A9Q8WI41_9PEZI|nr:uncharacterized protein CLUP02_09985 [Colletotrichum lupini]KAK1717271.1 hypothetical protein BDP67DRAFT_397263 [Colletotrichum lupini]UQC84488.1 hypothetical protein CLUP02_09985 [Colletotrichum lupini]
MHKSSRSSKHKSKSGGGRGGSTWSAWSDWQWNPDYQKNYRYRMNSNGEYDYEWQDIAMPAPAPQDDFTPRAVDELTETMDNLDLPPTTEHSYGYEGQDIEHNDPSYMYEPSATSQGSSGRSRKGKETAYAPDPPAERSPSPEDPPPPPLDPFWGAKGGTTGLQDEELAPPQAGAESLYHESEGYGTAHDPITATYSQDSGYATADLDDYDDLVVQEAVSDRNEMYGTSGHGGSSTDPAYGTAYPAYEEDDGTATPKGRQSPTPSFDISGTHGSAEDLDPRYVVEPSHKFRPGSVFKVLWSEPSGSHAAGNSTISEKQQIQDQFGGSVFIGFRRFIVIANDEGHCTCVPILTYQGKACNKRGVKAHKHGMIYSHKPHRPLRDEPKLGFPPVRAKITIEGEKLAKESRVNYSKLVTVEHNVKVFFIGYISPDDFEDVEYAVDDCWEKKTRAKKKSRK